MKNNWKYNDVWQTWENLNSYDHVCIEGEGPVSVLAKNYRHDFTMNLAVFETEEKARDWMNAFMDS